jgi:hypothetical protein
MLSGKMLVQGGGDSAGGGQVDQELEAGEQTGGS